MRVPLLNGLIERRLLLNYCVRPDVLAKLLPAPFRPQVIHGWAMAGICLIRLSQVRPRGVPGWLGLKSENAAHRMAVQWEEAGQTRTGVYIPRRDTSSALNAWAGGTLFPGEHRRAKFQVSESPERVEIEVSSQDGSLHLSAKARRCDLFPADSIFENLQEASEFFAAGCCGYSTTKDPEVFDGLELLTREWKVEPLDMEKVTSSFFDDLELFPAGSIQFDCGLFMQDIPHSWHDLGRLRAEDKATGQSLAGCSD